jgi:putative transposase
MEKMIWNDAGKIANVCWLDIPKHLPNSILFEHILMPNHIHGIIELKSVGAENFPLYTYIMPIDDVND